MVRVLMIPFTASIAFLELTLDPVPLLKKDAYRLDAFPKMALPALTSSRTNSSISQDAGTTYTFAVRLVIALHRK